MQVRYLNKTVETLLGEGCRSIRFLPDRGGNGGYEAWFLVLDGGEMIPGYSYVFSNGELDDIPF